MSKDNFWEGYVPEPVKPAQQEPVATVIGKFLTRKDELRTCIEPELPLGTKLYTSPPAQRTWVGLTDDEIDLFEELYAPPVHPDFVNDADHCLELIRHVEAKLKEKNT